MGYKSIGLGDITQNWGLKTNGVGNVVRRIACADDVSFVAVNLIYFYINQLYNSTLAYSF